MISIKKYPTLLKSFYTKCDTAVCTFAIFAIIFSFFFAFAVPIGYSDDEYAHIPKAFSVANGHFFAKKIGVSIKNGVPINYYGEDIPVSIYNVEGKAVSEGVGLNRCKQVSEGGPSCKLQTTELKRALTNLYNSPVNFETVMPMNFGGASAYIFIPYLPSAFGINIGRILNMDVERTIELARLFSAFTYIIVVTYAIFLLRHTRIKWVLFVVGLLPQSLVMATSVGVDMLLNSLSLLLFAVVILSFTQNKFRKSTLVPILLFTSCMLPLLKAPYIVLSITGILFFFRNNLRSWTPYVCVLLVISVSAAYSLFIYDISLSQSLMMHGGSSTPNAHDQLYLMVTNPLRYARVLIDSFMQQDWLLSIGNLTHQRVPVPPIVTAINYFLIAVSGLIASIDIQSKKRIVLGAVMLMAGAATVICIATGLYVAYTPVASDYILGVQGRYFIPCLPILALGLGLLANVRVVSSNTSRYIFTSAPIILLLISSAYYLRLAY